MGLPCGGGCVRGAGHRARRSERLRANWRARRCRRAARETASGLETWPRRSTRQAEASLRSGRAFLIEAIESMWGTLEHGDRAEQRTTRARAPGRDDTPRRARCGPPTWRTTSAGGSAIYSKNVLQRRFRDIHTLTAHLMVGPSSLEAAGRALLGLDRPGRIPLPPNTEGDSHAIQRQGRDRDGRGVGDRQGDGADVRARGREGDVRRHQRRRGRVPSRG